MVRPGWLDICLLHADALEAAVTPDPLEPLRKMIEKWRETAKYIAIGNSVGAGCLVQAADDLAAALPALEEAIAAERARIEAAVKLAEKWVGNCDADNH